MLRLLVIKFSHLHVNLIKHPNFDFVCMSRDLTFDYIKVLHMVLYFETLEADSP